MEHDSHSCADKWRRDLHRTTTPIKASPVYRKGGECQYGTPVEDLFRSWAVNICVYLAYRIEVAFIY